MNKYKCPECDKVVRRSYKDPTHPSWCTETQKDVELVKVKDEDSDE